MPSVSFDVRGQAITWMFAVQSAYRLETVTVFTAAQIMDVWLVGGHACPTDIVLVATCCLLLASKFCDAAPLTVQQCVAIMAGKHDARCVVRVEGMVGQEIGFHTARDTALHVFHFLVRLTSENNTVLYHGEQMLCQMLPLASSFRLCPIALAKEVMEIARTSPSLVGCLQRLESLTSLPQCVVVDHVGEDEIKR